MNQRDASTEPWLSAAEAVALLGVKRETLYAYASRGLVRTRPVVGSRERRYAREDVVRLGARSAARSGHGAVAASALQWGEPVLDTSVSAIDPALGPRYRGVPAVELARRGARFEEAAALLWGCSPAPFDVSEPAIDFVLFRRALPRGARPLERLALVVPMLALADRARFVTTEAAELERARRMIRHMVAALAQRDADARKALAAESVARAIAIAFGACVTKVSVDAIDRALVLCADHELNVSTFAARVAASSGADLYACTSAALAALSGPAHGGVCDRIEAQLAGLKNPEDAARAVHEWLARGDPLAGFGHPLYPNGDPRGAFLLEHAQRVAPRSSVVRRALAVRDAVRLAGAGDATLDHGLVALAAAAGLPSGAAAALFAIGRTAGWVAHVREQRASRHLLRPRARYVGRTSALEADDAFESAPKARS